MAQQVIDVLIVGAGPVGLVLANELSRFGINYRLVEKLAERSTWSKALMITSRTMLILEDIGLHEEILSKGTVVEGLMGMFNQREIGTLSMSIVKVPTVRYPYPFVLPQPDVEEAFEHVLNRRGGHIERSSEVVKIDPLKDYVEVTLESGELIRAKYVVGCDGAHSLVRHAQPWAFEGRPVNILWAQCDGLVKNENVHTTRAAFFLGKTGFSIRLPLYHYQRRFRFICRVPPTPDMPEQTNEFKYGRLEGRKPTLQEFNSLIGETMGPEHYTEVFEPTWLTYFTVQERMVEKLRMAGRLFLAGDAAHCHSPAGGQGMNLGIQDAHNLAWKLAEVIKGQSADSEKLLDSYTEERIPIIRSTIGLTAGLVRFMKAADSWYSSLIFLIFSIALKFGPVERVLVPRLLQSSLKLQPTPNGVLSRTATKMPAPGTMLPDPVRPVFDVTSNPPDVNGTTHPFALLQAGSRYTALFFIGERTLHEPHPIFQHFIAVCKPYSGGVRPAMMARAFQIGGFRKPDWAGDDVLFLGTHTNLNERAYGLNGKGEMGVILLRPDGYVAFSAPVGPNGNGLNELSTFMAKLFVKSG